MVTDKEKPLKRPLFIVPRGLPSTLNQQMLVLASVGFMPRSGTASPAVIGRGSSSNNDSRQHLLKLAACQTLL